MGLRCLGVAGYLPPIYVAFVAVLKEGTMVTWGEREMVDKLKQYRRR